MKDIKFLRIENCQSCPFCNRDNEYGYDACNLDDAVYATKDFENMPKFNVHENCPLKVNEIIITIN